MKSEASGPTQRIKEVEGGLNGADKVTALLLAMGKPMADRIIKKFEDREIRLVARCAAKLPIVPEAMIDRLVEELDAKLAVTLDLVGSPDGAQTLISGIVTDDQFEEIMSDLKGTASERIWSKLGTAADDRLIEFIANERPQVAAVVLSKLDVEKASTVLEKLSSEQRSDLSMRLLSLKPVSESAMRLISERLSHEVFRQASSNKEMNKHARLGAILTNLERHQIAEVIQNLEQSSPEDARRVKEHVFTFEDIVGLTAEDRARLFDEVPSERVVLALRDALPELKGLVLQALSPRSKRMVEAELANEINVTSKNIAGAKRAVATLAMALAERSVIRLRPEKDAAVAS